MSIHMFRNQLPKLKTPSIDDAKLLKAKQYPILELYTGTLKKMGKVYIGKCPFHNETQGSFAIYPETNTYNCFGGCGGGDVVKFYQIVNNCDFKTAVEELSK